MGTFGTKLRREREKRGLRLVDLARDTKVAIHYLTALEYEDLDSLPDDELARHHLRSYARQLEMDTAMLDADLEELLATRPTRESRPEQAARQDPTSPPPETEDPDPDEIVEEPTAAPVKESPAERPVAIPTNDDTGAGLDDRADAGSQERRRIKPIVLTVAAVAVITILIWTLSWLAGGDATGESSAMVSEAAVDRAAPSESSPGKSTEIDRPPTEVETPETDEDAAADRTPAATRSVPDPRPVSRIAVIAHGAGTGVVDRMLVGEGSRFTVGDQVWFWTRLQDGTVGEKIRHVWYHEGRVMDRVPLRVGGWHWRTQSRKTLLPGSEGRWAVEAIDGTGRVIARSEFLCVPASGTER